MATLQDLRSKYNFTGGSYEPKPDCKFCNGTGEKKLKCSDRHTFCICLFIDHEHSDFAGDSLGEAAKIALGELRNKLK